MEKLCSKPPGSGIQLVVSIGRHVSELRRREPGAPARNIEYMVEPLEEREPIHELETRATRLATIRDDEVDAARITADWSVELGRIRNKMRTE